MQVRHLFLVSLPNVVDKSRLLSSFVGIPDRRAASTNGHAQRIGCSTGFLTSRHIKTSIVLLNCRGETMKIGFSHMARIKFHHPFPLAGRNIMEMEISDIRTSWHD